MSGSVQYMVSGHCSRTELRRPTGPLSCSLESGGRVGACDKHGHRLLKSRYTRGMRRKAHMGTTSIVESSGFWEGGYMVLCAVAWSS
ncbi:hypothetical protein Mapa_013318 [Marchantia paleacea]|nr:hypothetical protein Mapa_013318 [Marchantia paleacea]